SESERQIEWRDPIGIDNQLDGACFTWDASDESALFQSNEHRIHRWRRKVEKPLEIGMSGGHSGLVSHHVLTDEGEELPLLASRTASERSGRCLLAVSVFQPTNRLGDPLGSNLDGGLDFRRGFRPKDLVLNSAVQMLSSLVQQRPRFGNTPPKPPTLHQRCCGCRSGLTHVTASPWFSDDN